MKVPAWTVPASQALAQAGTRVRMISTTTPLNLRSELDRLVRLWERGDAAMPRFIYDLPPDHDALVRALSELASSLDQKGPLGVVYASRARELADEAAICSSVGAPDFFEVARRRFPRRDVFDDEANVLAARWLEEPPHSSEHALRVRSDDEAHPGSLLSRMRMEIGTRKIPFRVIVVRDLSALAATGEGIVQVVGGRSLTASDVERTVLHEMDGHVMPRCRASSQRLGIFTVGTRFGADDQEGRALWLERRAAMLDVNRRRELAARHVTARMLEAGADFVEAGRELMAKGVAVPDALRIVSRVYRGSGLGREVVYLPALLRVSGLLSQDPTLDRVLGSGRVSVDAAEVLRPWVEEETMTP